MLPTLAPWGSNLLLNSAGRALSAFSDQRSLL